MDTVKTPIMPKKLPERLDELEESGSILITDDERTNWGTAIYRFHKSNSEKQFTIRKDKKTQEIRVWRLK
jgi:hypothetical protein